MKTNLCRQVLKYHLESSRLLLQNISAADYSWTYFYISVYHLLPAPGVSGPNHQKVSQSVCVCVCVMCVCDAGGTWQGTGARKKGWPAASRVIAPCDVLVIDTEHSTGLQRDPWTWGAVPGSSTGGLKSSEQLMFNPFDLCREVAFPEFLASVSSGRETMNGSTEDI